MLACTADDIEGLFPFLDAGFSQPNFIGIGMLMDLYESRQRQSDLPNLGRL
jgi:hypothetical protein